MTSPPADELQALRRILGQAEALFLDFDGPVCNLFAGLPASAVVDQLCVVLADGGYGDPPPEIEKSSDPFDVLKYAATLGKLEAEYVNAAFTAHEVEAVASAEPTQGAHDLIRAWTAKGRILAIVSNNSRTAVETYLSLHSLDVYVAQVAGRVLYDPLLLKPNPYLVLQALRATNVAPGTAVFIGDSPSDVQAAHSAGTASVGYANKPGKSAQMVSLGVDAITTKITALVAALL